MILFAKILFQGQSKVNGEVKVVESFGERRLLASGYVQSRTLNKKGLTGQYWDGFLKNIPQLSKDSRVLILGLGGGTVAKLLTNKFGPVAIDGVEIDPMMVDLGKKYLGFVEKNVNLKITDAEKFVADARYKYDLIVVDLFSHGSTSAENDSKEFFLKLKNLLTEDGVCAINKIFSNEVQMKLYESFVASVFPKIKTFLVTGTVRTDNVIIYGYN